MSTFANRNASRSVIADRYGHVVEEILKSDPMKKRKFLIHEFLQRLGVDSVEALCNDESILFQI